MKAWRLLPLLALLAAAPLLLHAAAGQGQGPGAAGAYISSAWVSGGRLYASIVLPVGSRAGILILCVGGHGGGGHPYVVNVSVEEAPRGARVTVEGASLAANMTVGSLAAVVVSVDLGGLGCGSPEAVLVALEPVGAQCAGGCVATAVAPAADRLAKTLDELRAGLSRVEAQLENVNSILGQLAERQLPGLRSLLERVNGSLAGVDNSVKALNATLERVNESIYRAVSRALNTPSLSASDVEKAVNRSIQGLQGYISQRLNEVTGYARSNRLIALAAVVLASANLVLVAILLWRIARGVEEELEA